MSTYLSLNASHVQQHTEGQPGGNSGRARRTFLRESHVLGCSTSNQYPLRCIVMLLRGIHAESIYAMVRIGMTTHSVDRQGGSCRTDTPIKATLIQIVLMTISTVSLRVVVNRRFQPCHSLSRNACSRLAQSVVTGGISRCLIETNPNDSKYYVSHIGRGR